MTSPHPMLRLFGFLFLACLAYSTPLHAEPSAPPLHLDIAVSHPYLRPHTHQRIYLKVGVKGGLLPSAKKRAPLNLAVVIDRSGSMSGERIARAKQAARMLVSMLQPDDILAIVTYDSSVHVLVPATKVTDKEDIIRKINSIQANGFTALFGGVSKGLAEVRKFLHKERVNRVILLSDGLANVGPRSPNALGRLGEASAKEGISITTIGIGLGYNEDLMTQLARRSDGNHGFARDASELDRIFRAELGDITTVIAQQVQVTIRCAPGIRPIRVLDRPAEIRDNVVFTSFNQLYSNQHKYLLLEIEPPIGNSEQPKDIAHVDVSFLDMQSRQRTHAKGQTALRYTLDERTVQQHLRRDVLIEVHEALGNEANQRAVTMRDKGQLENARKLLLENALRLQQMAHRLGSKRLKRSSESNIQDAKNLQGQQWQNQRKVMRKRQYQIQNQTNW